MARPRAVIDGVGRVDNGHGAARRKDEREEEAHSEPLSSQLRTSAPTALDELPGACHSAVSPGGRGAGKEAQATLPYRLDHRGEVSATTKSSK